MLDFSEHLRQGLIVVQIEFGVKGVLGFKSFELENRGLANFVRGTFGLLWDFHLEVIVA